MRLKNVKYVILSAACALFFLPSCQTAPKRDTAGEAEGAKEEAYEFLEEADSGFARDEGDKIGKRAPQWTRTYPAANGYYIGIGHSPDTGDPDKDRKRARLSALNELAQGISVHIEGEVRDRRSERYGKYYEDMSINIRSSVDLTVQDAELVDSFHSKADGYWVYYHLSKEQWEQQERDRKRRLVERVRALVEGPLNDTSYTVVRKIDLIQKAIDMTVDSGFAGVVRTGLFGRDGYLLDLLAERRDGLAASLSTVVEPPELVLSPEGTADCGIEVTSNNGLKPGVCRVVFYRENGEQVSSVTTDEAGGYRGMIDLSGAPFGRSAVTARVEPSGGVHAPAGGPEKTVSLLRRPYTVYLSVTETGGLSKESVYSQALEILSFLDSPGLRITGVQSEHDLVVEFVPSFRVIQNTHYKLYAAYAGARLTLIEGDKILLTAGSGEYKEIGLDDLQARQRAFAKLVEALKKDEVFQRRVKEALGLPGMP
jgi:hypothetical protein